MPDSEIVMKRNSSTVSFNRSDSNGSNTGSFYLPTYRPLIDRINDRLNAKTRFFSLEFFPAKTPSGAVSLLSR